MQLYIASRLTTKSATPTVNSVARPSSKNRSITLRTFRSTITISTHTRGRDENEKWKKKRNVNSGACVCELDGQLSVSVRMRVSHPKKKRKLSSLTTWNALLQIGLQVGQCPDLATCETGRTVQKSVRNQTRTTKSRFTSWSRAPSLGSVLWMRRCKTFWYSSI